MPTVRELITRFGFEADTGDLEKLEDSISHIKEGLAGLAAMVVGSATAIFGLVKASANAADSIIDTSVAVGVATEDLQKLGYAAQLNGADIETMGTGLRFLNKNLYEASKNAGGEMAQSFKKLGINIRDANGNMRPASDVLLDISDRVKAAKNPTEQMGIAMNFLGKGGGALVQTLRNGSATIKEFGDELDAMGGVLSDDQLAKLGAFNDSLDRLWALIRGIGMVVSANFAPVMTEVIDDFRQFLIANKEVIKTNLVGFIKALSSFLLAAWKVIKIFATGLFGLIKIFGGVEIATKIFLGTLGVLLSAMTLQGFFALISVVQKLGWAFVSTWAKALAPYILVVAAITAIFLIVEDLYNFFSGNDSVTGLLIEGLIKYFNMFKEYLSELLGYVADDISAWAKGIVDKMLGFFQPFIDLIKTIGTGMGALAVGDFKGAFAAAQNVFSGGSPTGINPSNSPTTNTSNRSQQFNVTAPIQVTVPPGTDPAMVGEKAESGISLGLEGILRNTQRASTPGVAY